MRFRGLSCHKGFQISCTYGGLGRFPGWQAMSQAAKIPHNLTVHFEPTKGLPRAKKSFLHIYRRQMRHLKTFGVILTRFYERTILC